MITASDILHLPYTSDLSAGGIAYALRSLPYISNRGRGSSYEALRRVAASAAVQLAFQRYLSEQNIPFEVKGTVPFTEHDRYDVFLSGRRCDLQSFLVSQHDQIAELKRNPQALFRAPALVASDQHAGDAHLPLDLYLFAFLAGQVAASADELKKVIEEQQPYYLIHVMPDDWKRPRQWNPLGRLVLKSESEKTQTVEIGGQDEEGEMRSCRVELLPRRRAELQNEFFSLSYVHIQASPKGRIGIHSPNRNETYLIRAQDWGNLWVYGRDIWLAGYITRDEFSRRARGIQVGSRLFPSQALHVKNLAVPVSELKPLSELFEKVKASSV